MNYSRAKRGRLTWKFLSKRIFSKLWNLFGGLSIRETATARDTIRQNYRVGSTLAIQMHMQINLANILTYTQFSPILSFSLSFSLSISLPSSLFVHLSLSISLPPLLFLGLSLSPSLSTRECVCACIQQELSKVWAEFVEMCVRVCLGRTERELHRLKFFSMSERMK